MRKYSKLKKITFHKLISPLTILSHTPGIIIYYTKQTQIHLHACMTNSHHINKNTKKKDNNKEHERTNDNNRPRPIATATQIVLGLKLVLYRRTHEHTDKLY